MMVKERFHRGMDAADFLAIHQKRTLEKKLVKEKRKKEIEMKAKKANVSKNKNDKSKVTKTAKTTSKRKVLSGSRSSISSNKKRKKLSSSAEAVKNKQMRKVLPSSDDKREGQVYTKETRRVREHKKLHDLFWKWDLWKWCISSWQMVRRPKASTRKVHQRRAPHQLGGTNKISVEDA